MQPVVHTQRAQHMTERAQHMTERAQHMADSSTVQVEVTHPSYNPGGSVITAHSGLGISATAMRQGPVSAWFTIDHMGNQGSLPPEADEAYVKRYVVNTLISLLIADLEAVLRESGDIS